MKLNISLKELIKNFIIKNGYYKISPSTKYTLNNILDVIEFVLKTGSSWRSLKLNLFTSLNGSQIKWESFYYHFNKFKKSKVFEKIYINLLHKYLKINRSGKLKYILIDSSYIKNDNAIEKTNYNPHFGKKKCSKLSLLTDKNGIPLSIIFDYGSKSDSELFESNINNMLVVINNKPHKNNKFKKYLLADSIYDTKNIRNKCILNNHYPLIKSNKRNTKDPAILKENKMSTYEKTIYKKRIKIENLFSWLYKNRRINRLYDKHVSTYMEFLYLALINVLIKRF